MNIALAKINEPQRCYQHRAALTTTHPVSEGRIMAASSLPTDFSNLKQRLFSRVAVDGDCITWMGHRNRQGYGRIGFGRSLLLAHRAAWIIHNGPIPGGFMVCHRCDNPPCINPSHLFLGTARENAMDMTRKGRHGRKTKPEMVARGDRHGLRIHPDRASKGASHYRTAITEDDVRMIRMLSGWLLQREIANLFPIKEDAIGAIISRRNWRHVS